MDVSRIKIPGYEEAINIKDEKARNSAIENAENIQNVNNELNDLETTVNNLSDSLNSVLLNNKNSLKERSVILIGDSYGTGDTVSDGNQVGWIERLKGIANFKNVYSSAVNGAGFVHGDMFIQQLQRIEIADKNAITDIVVVGGYNDKDENADTLADQVVFFCNYVKENFPNAILHIGCAGWTINYTEALKISTTVLFSYSRATYYGARFMAGVTYALHNYKNFVSDGFHPNNEGQIELTMAIYNSLLYSTSEPTFLLIQANIEGTNGYNLNVIADSAFDNGIVQLWRSDTTYITLSPKTLTANVKDQIATIAGGTLRGVVTSPIATLTSCYVPAYIDYEGSNNMQLCELSIEQSNIVMLRIIGINDTQFNGVKAILLFPFKIISSAHLS